jgi:hypothetical protein
MRPRERHASGSRPGKESRKSCPIAAESAFNRCRNGEADDILNTMAANSVIPYQEGALNMVPEAG